MRVGAFFNCSVRAEPFVTYDSLGSEPWGLFET